MTPENKRPLPPIPQESEDAEPEKKDNGRCYTKYGNSSCLSPEWQRRLNGTRSRQMTRSGSDSNLLDDKVKDERQLSYSHSHSVGCLHGDGSREEKKCSKWRSFFRSKSESSAADETASPGRTMPVSSSMSSSISRSQKPRTPSATRSVIFRDGKSAAATPPTRPSLPPKPYSTTPTPKSPLQRQRTLSPEMRRLIDVYQPSNQTRHMSSSSSKPRRRRTEERASPTQLVRCVIVSSSLE